MKEVFSSFIPHPSSLLKISATGGDGIDALKEQIVAACLKNWPEEREGVVISNLRHKMAIEHACGALERGAATLEGNQHLEIVALELRDGLDRLGEIVGAVTTEDILNRIFSNFCIGK